MVKSNLIFVSVDEIFHLKIELSHQDHFPITIDELDMQAVIGTNKTFFKFIRMDVNAFLHSN